MLSFSKDFLIGAATAAHQVEGNNTKSDFWAMEQSPGSMFKEPSLDAVDHYNRFREDIDIAAKAGLNAYRFSIEWARIQPEKNRFDDDEIAHYREVLEYCKSKGVEPVVTMHHFTSPKWLIEAGGWECEDTVAYFRDYCAYTASKLGGLMNYVCTINEANMGIQLAKIIKERMAQMTGDVQVGVNTGSSDVMAQQMKAMSQTFGGMDPSKIAIFLSGRSENGDLIIMRAHEAARDAMKEKCPHLKVGVTLSLYDYQTQPGGEEETLKAQQEDFLHYLPFLEKDDFLGVQNYSRKLMGSDGAMPYPEDAELTQMNYEFYPEAIGNVLRYVSKHISIPLMVTENGVATADDSRRVEFIQRALKGVKGCVNDGIPVLGYLYWSLLDNFEWMLGFGMTFGLIEVDRSSQKRLPKESLYELGRTVRK